jgi:hypothetical protein
MSHLNRPAVPVVLVYRISVPESETNKEYWDSDIKYHPCPGLELYSLGRPLVRINDEEDEIFPVYIAYQKGDRETEAYRKCSGKTRKGFYIAINDEGVKTLVKTSYAPGGSNGIVFRVQVTVDRIDESEIRIASVSA